MGLYDSAKELVLMLKPPPVGATAEQIQKYRWTNYLFTVGLAVGFAVHVSWICGAFGAYGLGGAAFAADLAGATSQIDFLMRSKLEDALQNDQLAICRLADAANKPGADVYILQFALTDARRTLNADLWQYKNITKQDFVLQSCNVILIVGGSKL